MTIAELFVNLGIKGADSAGKALKGVQSGLGEVKSMSLEAKAAIIGVVYGLEKLMSQSAAQGTNLMNFNALTGLSTQNLQEWQYAARQAGVAGEDFTGSLKGVQNSVANMLMGKGGIEGFAMVANKVGLDKDRMRDTFYVMEQLQKFAQTVPEDVGNQMIKSFGVSEGTISAMRRNAFTPTNFAKAPKYSPGEIGQLGKVDVAWANLGNKIQMAMGHFTSKHGMQLVSDLDKVATSVLKLTEAFMGLAEQLKLFTGISKIFEGWGLIFTGLSNSVKTITTMGDFKSTTEPGKGGYMQWWKEGLKNDFDMIKNNITPDNVLMNEAGIKQNQVIINQNLNFQHDGKDHKKTGDSVKKAVQDSYRQMSAQGQGS